MIPLGDITNTTRQPITTSNQNTTTSVFAKSDDNTDKKRSTISTMVAQNGNILNFDSSQRFKQFKKLRFEDNKANTVQQKSHINENQKLNNQNYGVNINKERKLDLPWRRVENNNTNHNHVFDTDISNNRRRDMNNVRNDNEIESTSSLVYQQQVKEKTVEVQGQKSDTSEMLGSRMIPCPNWHQFSVCFEGEDCPNSHKIHCIDFRRHVTNYKCKPCVDPALGKKCIYGNNCNFVHPGEELRRPMPIPYVDKQYYTLLLRDCPTSRFPFGIYL